MCIPRLPDERVVLYANLMNAAELEPHWKITDRVLANTIDYDEFKNFEIYQERG